MNKFFPDLFSNQNKSIITETQLLPFLHTTSIADNINSSSTKLF
jgi:hypothetical protein